MNKLYFLLVSLFLLIGCKEKSDAILLIESGVYKGTFSVDYNGNKQTVNNIEIVLNSDNTYQSTGNLKTKIPAGGSGTYVIKNNNVILFNDKNYWTAEFDPGLILSQEYQMTIKNKNLILTKQITHENSNAVYVYNLIKE